MKDQNMIETNHLKIYPASRVQMEAVIAAETDDEMKLAYTEMLCGATAHPEQWEWYAIWMIELKDGTHIGDLCFKGLSGDGATEIGYGITEEHQGCGYATEAVSTLVDWALKQPGVMCVTAETEETNIASQKVLKKAGFIPTGKVGEEGPLFSRRITICPEEHKDYKLEYTPTEEKVITDKKWLLCILEQYISNAVKYTNGGTVMVEVCGETLTVSDTGIGISKADLPRIFEKAIPEITAEPMPNPADSVCICQRRRQSLSA